MLTVALANTLFFSVDVHQARSRVALYLIVTMAPFAVVAPVVGPLVYAYYLPGVKQLANAGYKWLAKRRYKYNAADCDGGTCKLHAHG